MAVNRCALNAVRLPIPPPRQNLVRLRGLEPPSLAGYAPQAYVYTIPPQPHVSTNAETLKITDMLYCIKPPT